MEIVEDLRALITSNLDGLLPVTSNGPGISTEERVKGLYKLLGLYEQGYVKWSKDKGDWVMELELDNFQILSPYRGEGFGTLGLNEHVKNTYNPGPTTGYGNLKRFDHGDKLIRLNNWYAWDKDVGGRTLRLSNGSIGVACDNKTGRRYYFPETGPLVGLDDQDNFELAYAITVHKAQGSEFEHVFFVLPRKKSLLTKELIYTALTRSKQRFLLLLQESDGTSPLEEARERSAILLRNTSLFDTPEDIKDKLWPAKYVPVKSKVEYILYKYLEEAQRAGLLKFKYEDDLYLKTKGFTIHPDFTIKIGPRTYFWEHLGELDLKQYSQDWKSRRQDYETNGFIDQLITTDDLEGIRDELVGPVIDDLVKGKPKKTKDSFSEHHYQLYPMSTSVS